MGKVCTRCKEEWELEFFGTVNRGDKVYDRNVCKFCAYDSKIVHKPNEIARLMSGWKR